MREEDWRGISLSQLSLFVSYDFVAIDFVVAAADDGGMPRRRRNAGGHEVPPDALQPLTLLPDDDVADISLSLVEVEIFSSSLGAVKRCGVCSCWRDAGNGSTNRYA